MNHNVIDETITLIYVKLRFCGDGFQTNDVDVDISAIKRIVKISALGRVDSTD